MPASPLVHCDPQGRRQAAANPGKRHLAQCSEEGRRNAGAPIV